MAGPVKCPAGSFVLHPTDHTGTARHPDRRVARAQASGENIFQGLTAVAAILCRKLGGRSATACSNGSVCIRPPARWPNNPLRIHMSELGPAATRL